MQELQVLLQDLASIYFARTLARSFYHQFTESMALKWIRMMQPCDKIDPVFVHEFCKLLGKHGVPEYGLGSLAFPDFLQLSCHSESEKKTYAEVY